MVTDGILDSRRDILRKEDWVDELLKNTNISNPQELADMTLQKALQNCGNNPMDDMTVLVARVSEADETD